MRAASAGGRPRPGVYPRGRPARAVCSAKEESGCALGEPRLRTRLTAIGRPSWSPGDLRRLLQPARPQEQPLQPAGQPLAALWLVSLELMGGDTLEGSVG